MGCEEVGIDDGCVVVGGIHDVVLGWDEVEDINVLVEIGQVCFGTEYASFQRIFNNPPDEHTSLESRRIGISQKMVLVIVKRGMEKTKRLLFICIYSF